MGNNNDLDLFRHIARDLDIPYHNYDLVKNPDIYRNSFNIN